MAWVFAVLLSTSFAQDVSFEVLQRQEVTFPPSTLEDRRPWSSWMPGVALLRHSKKYKGKTIYDYQVTRSSLGFRTYPALPIRKSYSGHLILAGCSFTYGEGLKDEDTFGYRLQHDLTQYHVFNMGRPGGDVAKQLFMFKYHELKDRIPEKEGLMIYTIFSDHFDRLARGWKYLSWGQRNFPVFEKVNNEWVYDGILGDRFEFKWAQLMKRSGTEVWWLRLMSHFQPDYHTNSHEGIDEQMVSQLQALKAQYQRQYPKGRFVVSWFAHAAVKNSSQAAKEFTARLRAADIEVWENPLDPARLKALGGHSKLAIEHDGHPSALSNTEYGNFLKEKIKSKVSLPAL